MVLTWLSSKKASRLVLVALVVFCLGLLMVPAAQAHGDHGEPGSADEALILIAEDMCSIHGDMHKVAFWARVQAIGVWGIVIAVLGLAFVMRQSTNTNTDK